MPGCHTQLQLWLDGAWWLWLDGDGGVKSTLIMRQLTNATLDGCRGSGFGRKEAKDLYNEVNVDGNDDVSLEEFELWWVALSVQRLVDRCWLVLAGVGWCWLASHSRSLSSGG